MAVGLWQSNGCGLRGIPMRLGLNRGMIGVCLLHRMPLRWVRRALVPQGLRDRVKRVWTMEKKPELSPAAREFLSSPRKMLIGNEWVEAASGLGVHLVAGRVQRGRVDAELFDGAGD